jgi:hypothetical protein
MYRLKLRMRFVLSDKTAKQKTWFLLCSAALRRRAGLVRPASVRCSIRITLEMLAGELSLACKHFAVFLQRSFWRISG